MPLPQSELTRLDAIQRTMLQSTVGWVRIPDQDWRDIIVGMRSEVNNALEYYRMENWRKQFGIRQYNFAAKFAKQLGWLKQF